MHIVLTVNQAWNIWNFRRPLVEALIADGHRVTVLAPFDDTVARIRSLGAEFVSLEMNAGSFGAAQNLALLPRLRRAFRDLSPDVVCSFTIKNNLFGAIAARSLGIPLIPNVTGLGTIFLGSRKLFLVGKALYRIALSRVPVVFVQNGDDRDFLVSNAIVRADQLRLLPGSGIDIERFAPSPLPPADGGVVFLMISRLLRDKGIEEFLAAARSVGRQGRNARFRILGSMTSDNATALGPGELQPFIDDGSVEYAGTAEDVRPSIEAAHCVVLPSYREGAPRSLIEAASMGRPLIATDVPGCRAVVDHEVTGLLCEARSADALAAAFHRMLDLSPSTWQEMGAAGRAKMEREFAVEHVVAAYRTAIAQLTPRP